MTKKAPDENAETAPTEPSSLAAALPLFHQKVKTIHKAAKGQYGEFADLATVLGEVTPKLSECGLSVTQTFEPHGDDDMLLVTTLLHSSGDVINSKMPLINVVPSGGRSNPLHAWGGAVTYQRRYALLAILNLAAGIKDDDGDAADGSTRGRPQPRSNERRQGGDKPSTQSAGAQLQDILIAFGKANTEPELVSVGKQARDLPAQHIEAAKRGYATRLTDIRGREQLINETAAALRQGKPRGLADWIGTTLGVVIESEDDVHRMSSGDLEQIRKWLHEQTTGNDE
jgi:hypothetical protein